MKKKLNFMLVIIAILSVLSIALVSCAPTDPEAFTAADSLAELEHIYDAWAKENLKLSQNNLGLDARFLTKMSSKDYAISLQAAITKENDEKDAFRFAISDGTKKVVELIANNKALYFYLDGFNDKTIKIPEAALPELGNKLPLSFDSLNDMLKIVIVNFVDSTLKDGRVIVDPIKKDGKFDVKYTFSIGLSDVVEQITSLIPIVPEQAQPIIDSVAEMLDDVDLNVVVNTSGNEQTKAKKPKKGEHKYVYSGGTLTSLSFDIDGMNVNANDFKITDQLPTITAPNDENTIAIDDALFPSQMSGNFVMKDEAGNFVSEYKYDIKLDFTTTQLVQTINQCMVQKSAMPLVNKMFADKKGKIFAEITHECENNCKINHASKVSRPLLTIAYDPESFGTDRVYVAFNAMGVLPNPDDFGRVLEQMIPQLSGMGGTIASIYQFFPVEDIVFSVSPTAYIKMEELKGTPAPEPASKMIATMMNTAIRAKSNNGKLIIPIQKILNEMDGVDKIRPLLDLMLPNVKTFEVTSNFKAGEIEEKFNIADKFKENREFRYLKEANEDTPLDEFYPPINSKITYEELSLQGKTYDQIMAMKGTKIKGTYTNMKGEQKTEELTIIDVVGLDPNKTGEQKIGFVVSGTLGNSFYPCRDGVVGFAEQLLIPLLKMMGIQIDIDLQPIKDFRVADDVLIFNVTI